MTEKGIKFIPYHLLNGRPNLMVDGAAVPGTVLTLSHWPKSGTPWPLKADLSAEIVFNYLKKPEFAVEAEAATNTHFDTDGLVGVWAAINPQQALAHENYLVEIARAGDFTTFSDWKAFRTSTVLNAYADKERSPLPADVFQGSGKEVCGKTYEALLNLLPEIMQAPEKFSKFWQSEEKKVKAAEEAIKTGRVRLREDADLDLAVFEVPGPLDEIPAEALHRATDRFAILLLGQKHYRFYYRYETWVQYVSRPFRPRVDLKPLAERLTAKETNGGKWEADAADWITPELRAVGAEESSLEPATFELLVKSTLASQPPAFDPFDPKST